MLYYIKTADSINKIEKISMFDSIFTLSESSKDIKVPYFRLRIASDVNLIFAQEYDLVKL